MPHHIDVVYSLGPVEHTYITHVSKYQYLRPLGKIYIESEVSSLLAAQARSRFVDPTRADHDWHILLGFVLPQLDLTVSAPDCEPQVRDVHRSLRGTRQ